MKRIVLPTLLFAFMCAGHAQDPDAVPRPSRAFIAQGGVTVNGGYSLAVGAAWPWEWRRISRTGEWTGSTEVFASLWSSRVAGDRVSFRQVGIIPVVRYRFDHGRSNWFAEAGIGLSYMDDLYRRETKQFSTRWNFIDVVGVGYSFGERRENELALRVAHISNAGFKRPNPGENFLQLRYARNF
jgi:lipid A 3-O-deacylase